MGVQTKRYAVLLAMLALAVAITSACGNGSGAKSESATKTVSTVNGDVEIPAEPKRIVALYYHHMLFALDIQPVGANLTWWGGSPYLQDQEADVVDVGGPPSVEAVAALNPDLIIMNSNNTEDYAQFAEIAPSVLIPYDPDRNSFDEVKLIGGLLGKSGAADKLISDFEAKAAAARDKISGKIAPDAKVAIIRLEGGGSQFSIFGENYGRAGWPIYRGLQLQQPDRIKQELEEQNAQIVQQLSLELLPEFVADADYILLSNEGEGMDAVTDSNLWNHIPAVVNNKVIELDYSQYFFFDPLSIMAQMDLIADKLLEHSE